MESQSIEVFIHFNFIGRSMKRIITLLMFPFTPKTGFD